MKYDSCPPNLIYRHIVNYFLFEKENENGEKVS